MTENCESCGEEVPEDNVGPMCGPCSYDYMVKYFRTEMF